MQIGSTPKFGATPSAVRNHVAIDMPSDESSDSGIDIFEAPSDTPDSRDFVINAPADADGNEMTLSMSEECAAWIATILQQAIVSGLSWGFVHKSGAIIGVALAGPAGALVGAVVGQIVGGTFLGPAHYLVETGCLRLREAIGHGCQLTPTSKATANCRENTFIGVFTLGSIAKTFARPEIVNQVKGGEIAALAAGLGVDVGVSAVSGAIAQTISSLYNSMTGQEVTYKPVSSPPLDWREALRRAVAGGMGVAMTNGSFDVINTAIAASTAPYPVKEIAQPASSGARTALSLLSWFKFRAGLAA